MYTIANRLMVVFSVLFFGSMIVACGCAVFVLLSAAPWPFQFAAVVPVSLAIGAFAVIIMAVESW